MLFSLVSTFMYRKELEQYYNDHEGRILTMSHHATTIFITWQIVSALPAANKYSGGGGYPDPFSRFATLLEMFSLDFFSLFHLDCLQGTDYYYKMYVASSGDGREWAGMGGDRGCFDLHFYSKYEHQHW